MMIRIFLAAMAVCFAAFGLWSLLNPIMMASGLGVEVGGPNGAYELPSMARPALWFLAAYLGGYVFARGAALLLGPPPTPDFYAFIAFEIICLALTFVALRANAGR